MALFHRLFHTNTIQGTGSAAINSRYSGESSSRQQSSCPTASTTGDEHCDHGIKPIPFCGGKQLRLVLYQECDIRGRDLLFDSNCFEEFRVEQEQSPSEASGRSEPRCVSTKSSYTNTTAFNIIEICDGIVYKKHAIYQNSDEKNDFGEMVFGALAMTFRGVSLKVHWLQEPARMLCSQVFLAPRKFCKGSRKSSQSSVLSTSTAISTQSNSMIAVNSSNMRGETYELKDLKPNDSIMYSSECNPSMSYSNKSTHHRTMNSVEEWGRRTSSGQINYYPQQAWLLNSNKSTQSSTLNSFGSSILQQYMQQSRKFSIDSNYYSNESSSNPSGNNSNHSIFNTNGIPQRRISRNLFTSFENCCTINDFVGFFSDHRYSNTTKAASEGENMIDINKRTNQRHDLQSTSDIDANKSYSNPEMNMKEHNFQPNVDTALNCPTKPSNIVRRAKFGLALCIQFTESFIPEMEIFCCEHVSLLESILNRIRIHVERAYIDQKNFYKKMYRLWKKTQQWCADLFTAPRIPCHIWSHLVNSIPHNKFQTQYCINNSVNMISESFMTDLCWLLSCADTKETNFFVSTLLTATLTHHLGWVFTVLSSKSKYTQQMMNMQQLSSKYPYNALWAQMSDLYGAYGHPTKVSRTIICGQEKAILKRVLNVLIYFIRCADVKRLKQTSYSEKRSKNDSLETKRLSKANHEGDRDFQTTVTTIQNETSNDLCCDALEAIEIDTISDTLNETNNSQKENDIKGNGNIMKKPRKWSLWNIVTSPVKDGFSENSPENSTHHNNSTQHHDNHYHREYGKEPLTEVNADQIVIENHRTKEQNKTDKSRNSMATNRSGLNAFENNRSAVIPVQQRNNGVLFVLGENEPLVNIKHGSEDFSEEFSFESSPSVCDVNEQQGTLKSCSKYKSLNDTMLQTRSSTSLEVFKNDEDLRLLKLPLPLPLNDVLDQNQRSTEMVPITAGFVPSLFLDVTDHYISDVVLHGILTPPQFWESELRDDLTIANRSASFVSLTPAENVAIVGDLSKWSVRLLTSHCSSFPHNINTEIPVGMSELVSSMLETVHAMHQAGISANQCLYYMESKLEDIYMQSETLASFLLNTEFCSLSTITNALNLSENDMLLLLAVASVHTPQISEKCGISFR